jgi:hypothetical protein
MSDLKEWLSSPKTGAGAGALEGAGEDLRWLGKQKDLSSVALGEKPLPEAKGRASSSGSVQRTGSVGGGGGGFAKMFGCAGRRK